MLKIENFNLCGLIVGLTAYAALLVVCGFAAYGFAKFMGWA